MLKSILKDRRYGTEVPRASLVAEILGCPHISGYGVWKRGGRILPPFTRPSPGSGLVLQQQGGVRNRRRGADHFVVQFLDAQRLTEKSAVSGLLLFAMGSDARSASTLDPSPCAAGHCIEELIGVGLG
jgi:hypothetical protein